MTKTIVNLCRQQMGALTAAVAFLQAPRAMRLLGLLVAFTWILMSGCGFHLRGHMPLPEALHNVNVSAADLELQPITAELIQALRQRGAKVNQSYARTRIELSQQSFSRYQISTRTDASAAGYEYRYQIHYRFTDLFNPDRPAVDGSLQSRMTQQALDNNTIGQEHSETLLKQRLERDLAQRLLQRLARISQGWDRPVSSEPVPQSSLPPQPRHQSTLSDAP